MNNGAEAPLVDLLRDIPTDHRTGWVTQLDEAGNETGHAMCPIGNLAHKAADMIQSQDKRIAELGAELKTHKDKLVHVGYTNPHQVKYAKDESGLFYPDTENECYIPLYMLKQHEHRLYLGEQAEKEQEQEQ
jgi:hypothetical protein